MRHTYVLQQKLLKSKETMKPMEIVADILNYTFQNILFLKCALIREEPNIIEHNI